MSRFAERDEEIVQRYLAGENTVVLGRAYHVSASRIDQILKPHRLSGRVSITYKGATAHVGLAAHIAKAKADLYRKHKDRDAEILALVSAGRTYGEVAADLDVTRSLVAGALWRLKKYPDRLAAARP